MENNGEFSTPAQGIHIQISPAPIWVRFLAAAADCVVAGLLAFAFILIVLIPYFYPETQVLIYEYAEQTGGSIVTDTELAKELMENESLRNMVVASQLTLYSVFFMYYLLSDSLMRGSSLGKKIFRISTVRILPGEPLTISTIFLRCWLKTVFLLLLAPLLWLAFFWALVRADRRAVHDLITGTWVID
jgi:uncharacterized RDD family membrane protein YckC